MCLICVVSNTIAARNGAPHVTVFYRDGAFATNQKLSRWILRSPGISEFSGWFRNDDGPRRSKWSDGDEARINRAKNVGGE